MTEAATGRATGIRYKRILLKLSGEALLGDRSYGVDPAFCAFSSAGPWTAMTADSPSITPIRPVGQERMKSGSNPCPAIA